MMLTFFFYSNHHLLRSLCRDEHGVGVEGRAIAKQSRNSNNIDLMYFTPTSFSFVLMSATCPIVNSSETTWRAIAWR